MIKFLFLVLFTLLYTKILVECIALYLEHSAQEKVNKMEEEKEKND